MTRLGRADRGVVRDGLVVQVMPRPRRFSTQPRNPDDLVAVVVSTRPYSATELIPLLVRNRFTSIERGRMDALAFVQHLQPDMVVALIDPARFEDLELLRNLSHASNAMLLVIAPTNEAAAATLRAGADLFLRDSDGPEALDAQFVALRRRMLLDRNADVEEVLEIGPLLLNRASRQAVANGKPLSLTNMEFSLLLALAQERGKVLSPVQAARASSGRFVPEAEAAQTVKVYVRRLRQKLEEAGCPPTMIVNVRGRGYMLDAANNVDWAAGL